jgi:hypothetical protein
MTTEIPEPEEQGGRGDAADRHDAAQEILRESEQRVSDAAQSTAPGDAADEHRHSEDTLDTEPELTFNLAGSRSTVVVSGLECFPTGWWDAGWATRAGDERVSAC